MSSLPDKIREARKAKNLTQSGLAAKLGLEYKAVNHWEKGRTQPNDKRVPLLCKILDLDPGEILDLKYQGKSTRKFLAQAPAGAVSEPSAAYSSRVPEPVQDAMQTEKWRILSPAPDEIEMVCTMTGYEGAGLRDADAVLKVIRELPWRRIKALFDENKVPGDKQEECIRLCRAIINDWRTQDRKLSEKEETGK